MTPRLFDIVHSNTGREFILKMFDIKDKSTPFYSVKSRSSLVIEADGGFQDGCLTINGRNKSLQLYVKQLPACCGIGVFHSIYGGTPLDIVPFLEFLGKELKYTAAMYCHATTDNLPWIKEAFEKSSWHKIVEGKNPKTGHTLRTWIKHFNKQGEIVNG